jgi:xylulokinase
VTEPAILGLDIGTTEAKAGLFGLDGRPLGIAHEPYPTDLGPDGRAEQDPTDWWAALGRCVRAIDRSGIDVVAICGVGQGPTLVAVDDDGRPVRPAITWQDRRVGNGGFGLETRLGWLAAEESDAVERARWLMNAWDALGHWLTGRAVSSLQRHEAALAPDALHALGIDPSRVPAPVPVGSVIGGLRDETAERLALAAGIPVIAGVNDGTASMLGAGLLEPGDAVDTGGASGGFGVYVDRPIRLPGVFSAPAPIDGRWVVGGAMAATGAALDWLKDSFLGGRWTLEELLAEAAAVPAGAEGLVFLPYLAGERAPIFDETARGVLFGFQLGHSRGHVVRAVLEGAAFAIRHVAEPILAAGAPVTELRLAGGPSRSDLWARIKADVTGFTVAIPRVDETAILGAAILGAVGVGLIPDRVTGIRQMTAIERRIAPDPTTRGVYDARYATYRALYPALRPSFAAAAGSARHEVLDSMQPSGQGAIPDRW